jgi:hypothetical protein
MSTTKNPFMDRAERTKNLTLSHKRSPKQEKQLALRVGGQVTPRSGAGAVKGDVRVRKRLRLEAKTTKNKSFSVTLEMIEKIEDAACEGGELPILVIEFIDHLGRPIKEIAVCPTYVLDSLNIE